MTNTEFLKQCLDMGKITQERYDKGIAKLQVRKEAKAEYKSKKASLSKAQMQILLDKLIE